MPAVWFIGFSGLGISAGAGAVLSGWVAALIIFAVVLGLLVYLHLTGYLKLKK